MEALSELMESQTVDIIIQVDPELSPTIFTSESDFLHPSRVKDLSQKQNKLRHLAGV